MTDVLSDLGQAHGVQGHPRWVRISHWIVTGSLLTLACTGVLILMVHPRLYWGEAGNELMPAFIELPISRNYHHGGWEQPTPFFTDRQGPVSAVRTYDVFNENGWARSLHFIAGWFLVLSGLAYCLIGIASGHFRSRIWPTATELAPRLVWRDVVDHLQLKVAAAANGSRYGVLQKIAYSFVIFVAAPLIVLTGLTMAPAVTAALPRLLTVFGGYQSARTIHFFAFVALLLFVFVHVVMIVASGFRRQLRAMTMGE